MSQTIGVSLPHSGDSAWPPQTRWSGYVYIQITGLAGSGELMVTAAGGDTTPLTTESLMTPVDGVPFTDGGQWTVGVDGGWWIRWTDTVDSGR